MATGAIDGGQVRAVVDSALREYGMPAEMRTDNGTPFATNPPGGLSELSIWWIRLGIAHERIEPGKPKQNGRHERFHLSLIQDCLDFQIGYDLRAQARIFARYGKEFNQQRPHEALDMRTPDSVWTPSPRPHPARVPEIEYGTGYHLRRVNGQGSFPWHGVRVHLGQVLAGEVVGVMEIDDDVHEVVLGPVPLGLLDGRTRAFVRADAAERPARKATPTPSNPR